MTDTKQTDTSRSGDLKPCPFCGEQCAVLNGDTKWAGYQPSCLEVRTRYDSSPDAEWRTEAIDAWNNRTTELSAGDGVQECDNLLVIDILKATGQEDDAAHHVLTLTNAAQLAARHRALAVAAERVRIKALEAEIERLRKMLPRMERVKGRDIDEWRSNLSPELYRAGDAVICWVNEGDEIAVSLARAALGEKQ